MPKYYYDGSFRPFEQQLVANRKTIDYPAGQQLVMTGEYMQNTFYVHSGILRFYIISATGTEKTVWFIGPGGLFPLYSPVNRHYKNERDELLVKTQTTARLTKIPQTHIRQLIKSTPDFAHTMVNQYVDFSSILLYDDITLSAQSSMTKVCNYLYLYKRTLAPRGIILTQGEIAANIGVPLLTLSRCLQQLRQQKVIATARKSITILNWQALTVLCSPDILDD